MTMNKWTPTTNLLMLRRMGKLAEELGELQAVAARCVIQGIDEIDPGSGKVNRLRLEQEIADVMAQCRVTVRALRLDADAINLRDLEKQRQMQEWEALCDADPATVYEVQSVRYLAGEVLLRAAEDAEVPQSVESGDLVVLSAAGSTHA